jgi:methyl-accepting chemotaxis protein
MNTRSSPTSELIRLVQGDPLLKGAVVVSLVIVAYQLVMLLLRPPWLPAATDWLRAGLAWLEIIPLALASYALYRARRPGALAWFMFTFALLAYLVAQNLRVWFDVLVYGGKAPFPYYPDIFYLLQYPFFFVAFALLPGVSRRGQPPIARVKVVLDSLLLMAAGTALSWYFFLAPAYTVSGESALGKATSLAYPVGDLGLLFGLAVALSRQRQSSFERITLRILIVAVVFLIGADTWYAYAQSYLTFRSGDLPDMLWIACYLLFALAGLVQYRLAQRQTRQRTDANTGALLPHNGRFGLFFSFIAAVMASIIIVMRATMAPIGSSSPAIPFAVCFGLIVLVAARQGVTVLENERLLLAESQRVEDLAVTTQIAEEQRQLVVERNQRLEQDIEALKEVHARIARGDYAARAPMTSNELLPIAGSLNLMLDRLAKLMREHTTHDKLDHAVQRVTEAAQGLAAGDDRAIARLTAPTNTPLDGLVIALGQLRTRIKELNAGLLQLEQARRASRELADITAQQGQFITNEGTALNGIAGTLARIASELERVIQPLEQVPNTSSPLNRQLVQVVTVLQALARTARQQMGEVEAQVVRFAKAEERANLAAIGGRRLAAELDAAARTGGSRVMLGVPGMAQALGAVPPTPPGHLAHASTKPINTDPRTSGPLGNQSSPPAPTMPVFPWEQSVPPPRQPGPGAPGQQSGERNGKPGI